MGSHCAAWEYWPTAGQLACDIRTVPPPDAVSALIIRPHCSTTHVDAAYSYRPSSVVCRSVCRSVTLVSPSKTAAPIELPFGLRTWMGRVNHLLNGDPDVVRDVAMTTNFGTQFAITGSMAFDGL